MSQVMRYVHIDYEMKTVCVKETFLGFIEIYEKDAGAVSSAILKKLESDGIDIQGCRSQCYDNAAVMSGHLSGVQIRILEKNPKAIFANCDNHSLNLCGVHAASVAPEMETFFDTVERIWTFFSKSTYRWRQLQEEVGCCVKRECATRWSARADAVNVVAKHYEKIVDVLEAINEPEAHVVLNSVTAHDFVTKLSLKET